VRKALLRAQEIFFHRCVNKHPVIIMRNFAGFDIKEAGTRAIDSAVRRCITVRPRAIKKVDLGDVFTTPPLYRLTGPTEAITTFASFAKPQNHFNVKASHVEGASVAHAYLDEEFLRVAAEYVLVERMSNIINSANADRQVTLRGKDLHCTQLLQIGIQLQQLDCTVTLRTYGTLRITLPATVTQDDYTRLKKTFPNVQVYTDTPINAWADSTTANNPTKTTTPEVLAAQADGFTVVRFATDTPPHPDIFQRIADKFNGSLVQACSDKFNAAAMACIIKFDPQAWNAVSLVVDAREFFEINGSVWQMTPIRDHSKKQRTQ
jgi:hypothetical protein